MERGETTSEAFMSDIYVLIEQMLSECRKVPDSARQAAENGGGRKEIGKCPVCGSPVYEGKNNFYCSNRACSFTLWKETRFLSAMKKRIDYRMAADLINTGRAHARDFYSAKTGKTFEADLLMKIEEDGKVSFQMEFPKRAGFA